MSAHSAIYVGSVAHRRLAPRPHALRYRVFWLLLDLDELPAIAVFPSSVANAGSAVRSVHIGGVRRASPRGNTVFASFDQRLVIDIFVSEVEIPRAKATAVVAESPSQDAGHLEFGVRVLQHAGSGRRL